MGTRHVLATVTLSGLLTACGGGQASQEGASAPAPGVTAQKPIAAVAAVDAGRQAQLLPLHEAARRDFAEFYGGAALVTATGETRLAMRIAASSSASQQDAFSRWLAAQPGSGMVDLSVAGPNEAELDAAAASLRSVQEVQDFAVDHGSGLIKVRPQYLAAAKRHLGDDVVAEWTDAPSTPEGDVPEFVRQ